MGTLRTLIHPAHCGTQGTRTSSAPTRSSRTRGHGLACSGSTMFVLSYEPRCNAQHPNEYQAEPQKLTRYLLLAPVSLSHHLLLPLHRPDRASLFCHSLGTPQGNIESPLRMLLLRTARSECVSICLLYVLAHEARISELPLLDSHLLVVSDSVAVYTEQLEHRTSIVSLFLFF